MLANYTRIVRAPRVCTECVSVGNGTPTTTVIPVLMLAECRLAEFSYASLLPQCNIENLDKRLLPMRNITFGNNRDHVRLCVSSPFSAEVA